MADTSTLVFINTSQQLVDQVQSAAKVVDTALHNLIIVLERLENCDSVVCDEHVIHNMVQIANMCQADFQSEFASFSASLCDAEVLNEDDDDNEDDNGDNEDQFHTTIREANK